MTGPFFRLPKAVAVIAFCLIGCSFGPAIQAETAIAQLYTSVTPATASRGKQRKDGSGFGSGWPCRREGELAGCVRSGISGGASWYSSAVGGAAGAMGTCGVLPSASRQAGQTSASSGSSEAEDIAKPHLEQ